MDPADAAAVMNDAIVVLKRVARDDGFAKGEVHRSNLGAEIRVSTHPAGFSIPGPAAAAPLP